MNKRFLAPKSSLLYLPPTELSTPFPRIPPWVPGEIITGNSGVAAMLFPCQIPTDQPMRFFRAAGGDTVVSLYANGYPPVTTEPCSPNDTSDPGVFFLTVNHPVDRPLTIAYTISGSAQNDTDYTNLAWCQLTNEADYVNSLYADKTGVWSNELLAVTADIGGRAQPARGVWRIHSQNNVEQVTRIPTSFLEGLLTVPNDSLYGPWAGKLLTGDESKHAIYAVDTSGNFETYYLGIDPDDFHIIEATNDIYCVNFQGSDAPHSKILKVSRNLLAPYVGDILITQAGELPDSPAELFIVHWNTSTGRFDVRGIPLPTSIGGHFEHVTLAPINIPNL